MTRQVVSGLLWVDIANFAPSWSFPQALLMKYLRGSLGAAYSGAAYLTLGLLGLEV